MTIFAKIKRTLFVLILINSGTSFAATFNFHIINSSDSIVNPITITDGIMYVESGNRSDPACASKEEPFTSDLKVAKGQEGIFSYDPKYPAKCYEDTSNSGVAVAMVIVTVDGKGISGSCWFPTYPSRIYDPNANINAGTVKITEMSDRFLCEFPIGALKR